MGNDSDIWNVDMINVICLFGFEMIIYVWSWYGIEKFKMGFIKR